MAIRLAKPHKHFLYATFLLLWASGVLWLVFHYFMQAQGEFGVTPHPTENWWLRLHGLMVFAALVGIGSVLPVHAQRAWQLKKNRQTGLTMKLLLAWIAATGYALYYFASEVNENWLPVLHWGAGLAWPLMLVLHIQSGRRRATTKITQPADLKSPPQNSAIPAR